MTATAQPSVDPIRDMARSVEERLEATDLSAIERRFMRVLSRLLAALVSFFEDLRAAPGSPQGDVRGFDLGLEQNQADCVRGP